MACPYWPPSVKSTLLKCIDSLMTKVIVIRFDNILLMYISFCWSVKLIFRLDFTVTANSKTVLPFDLHGFMKPQVVHKALGLHATLMSALHP